MTKVKVFASLLCFSIFLNVSSQISLSSLRSQGINSKEDLLKMGLSESEISALEKQYLNQVKPIENITESSTGEISKPINKTPVKNEEQVSAPLNTKLPNEKVFGQNVFNNGSFKLKENSDRINPSSSYTLGSGDRISITIWGSSEFNDEFTLDEFGNITPKLVGRISLKGMTFKQAKSIIASRFGKVYNLASSKIAVNLSFSKVISVNVVGEVKSPGTYTIPAINSAFNILSFSGGITENGSVRSIEIKRGGKVVSTLDLYEFLNNPKRYSHFTLQDGDFIVVNPLKNIIEIDGELNRNGSFEIKDGEKLSEIVSYAGGFNHLANKETIGYTTIDNGQYKFKSLNFKENKNLVLKAGDKIEVFKISELVYGVVQIIGAVNQPGKYQFNQGDKLLDVLKKAKGPTRLSYDNLVHVIRVSPVDLSKEIISLNLSNIYDNKSDNIELKEFDIVKVYDKSALIEPDSVMVYGKVLNPRKLAHYAGLTIRDIVLMSNGLKKEADPENIQIERISFDKSDSSNSYIKIIKIDLVKNSDFQIKPFDRIHFRALPEFKFQSSVIIRGEVRYPGNYTLNGRGEKLSSLIKRAGGVSDWAFQDGAKLLRKEDSLGLLLMDLKEVLNKERSKFDYVLKPGDIITVPKINNIVTISGAIGHKFINKAENNVNSPYHNGKRAGYYIKKYAGGYDKKAKKKNVYVVSSNGKVKETKLFGLIKPKIGAGDKIVVNHKEEKQKKEKGEPVNWNSVIENTTIKITGILTLLILANTAIGN